MNQKFNFSTIGLETRDKRVYESLVTNPQSSLRKIAVDTGINRGSVYESIKKLIEQGLVGSIEVGKQRKYIAAEPTTLLEIIKEKRELLDSAEKNAETYIENLVREQSLTEQLASFAMFYEDHEGIAAILRDVIATCRNGKNGGAYRVISTKQISAYMYQNFPNFTQRRIAENISVRVIGVENALSPSKQPLSERRILSLTRGEATNCYTIIYGNKTAFITLSDQHIISAIVIDNKGITHLQKEIFDRLWNSLSKTI